MSGRCEALTKTTGERCKVGATCSLHGRRVCGHHAFIVNNYVVRGAAPGRVWAPERIEDLRRLVGEGLSDDRIAMILGTTGRSVALKRHKLGLAKRRRGAPLGALRRFDDETLVKELERRGYRVHSVPTSPARMDL